MSTPLAMSSLDAAATIPIEKGLSIMTRKKKNLMTSVTSPSTPRSLDDKIALTEALLAKYHQQKLTLSIINNVEPGDKVTFKYGRMDSVRTLTGSVTGSKDTATGKYVTVLSGDGADVAVYKIRVQDITENTTAADRAPAATVDTPATTGGAFDLPSVDPLSVA